MVHCHSDEWQYPAARAANVTRSVDYCLLTSIENEEIVQFGNFGGTPSVGVPNEGFEFAKAWLGTALAFAVLFTGGRIADPQFATFLLLAALTAGLGVILHELAHRVVARHFGATAHFRANDGMLIISILLAFTGFLFAAPGAVWHSGWLSKRQSGLVAAAGPVTNMVLALIFVVLLIASRNMEVSQLVRTGLVMGFRVNGILGVFNMLPIGPIDGAKVLNWSTVAFAILLAIAIGIGFGIPRLVGLPQVF
jgi:Zn-dependent protease